MRRRDRRVPCVHFFEEMAELVRPGNGQLEILTRRCPRGANHCFGLERLA